MSQAIEKAYLFSVSGPTDDVPKNKSQGLVVMFNPTSLKVTLTNTVSDSEQPSGTRATQYIDKSSSTLAVDLIFDTSDSALPTNGTPAPAIDVRTHTGAIAREFMDPGEAEGDETASPNRCMFAWGTFIFVGIMDTFDETLDFFSPEGTPLRATLAIKLTESRFQFRSADAQAATRDSPTLGGLGQDNKEWRDTSLFNGLESPRLSLGASVSLPGISAKASLSMGGTSAFSMGASSSLGSNIPGAFASKAASISAPSVSVSRPSAGLKANAGIGFD